jgi:predicted metal-dependent peptidase
MIQDRVRDVIAELLYKEPFFGHFIMQSTICYDAMGVPTAGVGVFNGVPHIALNSQFVGKLSNTELYGVFKHEILHLLLDHLGSTKELKLDPYLSNIAQDCAINQYIDKLPPDCVTPELLEKITGTKLQRHQTSEYYYDALKKKVDQLRAAGVETLDEHGLEGQDPAEGVRGSVKRVAQSAAQSAAGNVANHILDAIGALGEAKLPWRTILRNQIMTHTTNRTQATRKRVSRRFALPAPGKKKKREMVLGVCVDESGSVSPEQHAAFMNEIQQIAKQVTRTYLVHADCEVSFVEDLSKAKFKPTRRSAGGTAYQPAITKCLELKCNMIVYFGDMDSADRPKNPGVPVLWVVVGSQKPPAEFGKAAYI